MAVYHQMGHATANLLLESGLSAYHGAILSPVNDVLSDVLSDVKSVRKKQPSFEFIFDPQLYFPKSQRGHLKKWSYFPNDVDTADAQSDAWWRKLVQGVIHECEAISPDAICSPAVVPRSYSDSYFAGMVNIGDALHAELKGSKTQSVQTAIVGLNELAAPKRSLAVASLLSRAKSERLFLVLISSMEPRRELNDYEEIGAAMNLIRLLRKSGMHITVGFCSSDVLLWKMAGAAHCSTGKFFNLRRFTKARFDEPGSGGGQLPYWFEESLLAFLRESDLLLVQKTGLLSDSSQRNPYGQEILRLLEKEPGKAWVGLSWKHYMWWFADIEARVGNGTVTVPDLLKEAEGRWLEIEDKILMEEPTNSGAWLRAWRRACIEFEKS
jgi:hypothetical protein